MTKQANFRIVVAESHTARDSRSVDEMGSYCPYKKNKPLTLDLDKVDKWIKNGAKMTEPVVKLVDRARKAAEIQGTRQVTVTMMPKPPRPSKKKKAKEAASKPAAEGTP